MAGIVNYYHGESGVIAEKFWAVEGDDLCYVLMLEGDPHRVRTQDYGGDISIDPALEVGERAFYARLDDTTGIWVSEAVFSRAGMSGALERALQNREHVERFASAWKSSPEAGVEAARQIVDQTGVRIVVLAGGGSTGTESPRAGASFFLSYSSHDVLLARELYEELRSQRESDVWWDLARSAGAPSHDADVAAWLERAIYHSRAIIVLLTRASAASEWVQRELRWATEFRGPKGNLQIVLLKANDVAVPAAAHGAHVAVIDCDGLRATQGMQEELAAVLFRRQRRKAWVAAQKKHGFKVAADRQTLQYSDFATDSGIARQFEYELAATSSLGADPNGSSLNWVLQYERDGQVRTARGAGYLQPADLGIRAGDQVGFYMCRRRYGGSYSPGLPLWMRSADIEVTSDMVLDNYYRHLPSIDRKEGTEVELQPEGLDRYGRVNSDVRIQDGLGRWWSASLLARFQVNTPEEERMDPGSAARSRLRRLLT